jgi:hypothetical protein
VKIFQTRSRPLPSTSLSNSQELYYSPDTTQPRQLKLHRKLIGKEVSGFQSHIKSRLILVTPALYSSDLNCSCWPDLRHSVMLFSVVPPQCCSSSLLRRQQIHTISFQIYRSLTSSRPTNIFCALHKGLVNKLTRFISWGLTKCLGLIRRDREITSCHAHNNTKSAYCCFASGNWCLPNHTVFHDQLVPVFPRDVLAAVFSKGWLSVFPCLNLWKAAWLIYTRWQV